MSEDCRSDVIVPVYEGKGEKTEFKNYRDIGLLSVIGKLYAGILVDRIRRVTRGLLDSLACVRVKGDEVTASGLIMV